MKQYNVSTIFSDIVVGTVCGNNNQEINDDFKRKLANGEFKFPDGTIATDSIDNPLWVKD